MVILPKPLVSSPLPEKPYTNHSVKRVRDDLSTPVVLPTWLSTKHLLILSSTWLILKQRPIMVRNDFMLNLLKRQALIFPYTPSEILSDETETRSKQNDINLKKPLLVSLLTGTQPKHLRLYRSI